MNNLNLHYNFAADKNQHLIQTRNISFEQIIAAINSDKLLDTIEHPNKKKYPNQKMYIVEINNYIYLVPFIRESEHKVFLKTIIPNRKANKLYRKGDKT